MNYDWYIDHFGHIIDYDWYLYYGYIFDIPVGMVFFLVLYFGIRAIRPRMRPLWSAAIAFFAGALPTWELVARMTGRLLSPVAMSMLMAGFLLTAIGMLRHGTMPIYARVIIAGLIGLFILWMIV